MDAFVDMNRGSTEDTVRQYEEELNRMLAWKQERMGQFVESAREEIKQLWDDLMVGEEERGAAGKGKGHERGRHFMNKPRLFTGPPFAEPAPRFTRGGRLLDPFRARIPTPTRMLPLLVAHLLAETFSALTSTRRQRRPVQPPTQRRHGGGFIHQPYNLFCGDTYLLFVGLSHSSNPPSPPRALHKVQNGVRPLRKAHPPPMSIMFRR